MDIGQHFTIFPEGIIVTGRSLESSPAGIYGFNTNSICIENVGDFDLNKDIMNAEHQDAVIRLTAALCKKFSIAVNTDKIVYHHWFNLDTGERNNGTMNNKTCPGTNLFGGNTVEDCQNNFIPLVSGKVSGNVPESTLPVLKYVCVSANSLQIRDQPDENAAVVTDRAPALLGSILRVYQIQNNWYKISSSKSHWVTGMYTIDVKRATINEDTVEVKDGPDENYSNVGSFTKGQEIFIIQELNGWCKISMEDKWVEKEYLNF